MEDRIKSVMAAVLDIDITDIDDNTSVDTIENWTSLKHMNLVLALEEEFGVEFDDEDIMNMVNYQLICLTVKESSNGSN